MKCPHCLVEFFHERTIIFIGEDVEGHWAIEKYDCPNPLCRKSIFNLINADLYQTLHDFTWHIRPSSSDSEAVFKRELIRPKGMNRPPVPKEVPVEIAIDYSEACLIISESPKASATLSRRALQNLLRQIEGIKKSDLANEIQQVLDSNQLPSYLAESIDAIRNIGNFAAHPLKSKTSGQIVDVEIGEAEWNLEVLEMLFDFYFVQPEKIKQRRAKLNQKLEDHGKPTMK